MTKPQLNLALDIGNVCIRIDRQNCSRALKLDAIPPALMELCTDYECGRIDDDGFFAGAQKLHSRTISRDEYEAAFNSILIEPVPGMSELVETFASRNIRPVFFSDISPIHLRRTRELFPAEACVPEGVYSFVAGAQKPAAAMFEYFEKFFGPCGLYVDDRPELIAAAGARSWHAVQFTSAEALDLELQKLGY